MNTKNNLTLAQERIATSFLELERMIRFGRLLSITRICSFYFLTFTVCVFAKAQPSATIEQHLYLEEEIKIRSTADDSSFYDSLKSARSAAKRFTAIDLIPSSEYFVGFNKANSIRLVFKSGNKQCSKHYNLYNGWAIVSENKTYSSKRIAGLGERIRHHLKRQGKKSKVSIGELRESLIAEWPSDWCDDQAPTMIDLILKNQKQKSTDSAGNENEIK